jgi:hypothetical protein
MLSISRICANAGAAAKYYLNEEASLQELPLKR